MTGRALCFVGPRHVAPDDVEIDPPRTDEVLVRTMFSGISAGTELLAYRGELDPSLPLDETIGALGGTFAYPFRYGYSCVGSVEALSSVEATTGLAVGDLVFAFHPHQDRFVASSSDVVPLDAIDARTATLFPLVETAFQASLDVGPVGAETVVVLGLGAVGILIAALLMRANATVLAAEPRLWRREAAERFGIDAVDPDALHAEVRRRSRGRGVPLLVEASGRPEALASGLSLLALEGTALVVSWYGTTAVPLPLGAEFHRRRLTIRSTQVSTIPAALSGRWSIARRREAVRDLLPTLPLDALATHTFPFERASDAYAALDRGEPGLVHAALCYG
jgi:2-desacetyl-2-hydroxyethyl bacteriochlorophyllide A dehydrogenase